MKLYTFVHQETNSIYFVVSESLSKAFFSFKEYLSNPNDIVLIGHDNNWRIEVTWYYFAEPNFTQSVTDVYSIKKYDLIPDYVNQFTVK